LRAGGREEALPVIVGVVLDAECRPDTSIQIEMICGRAIQNAVTAIPQSASSLQSSEPPILRLLGRAGNGIQIRSICGVPIQGTR
jgi:hypothetical protein